MDNKVQVFNSDEYGQVRAVKSDDGSILINAEDAAVGFGWTQVQNKNGRKYVSIRWSTFNSVCNELGFPSKVGKDDYIPESLFYLLAMKANSDAAKGFQKWIAMDVLPEIRKSGSYTMDGLSPELQAIFCLDKKTVEMSSRVLSLENNMTIDYSQQEELRTLVTKRVLNVLGGKNAPAYKELSKKVYCQIWNDYKRIMCVNSYRNTSVKKFEEARNLIINWNLPRDMELMIKGANVEH